MRICNKNHVCENSFHPDDNLLEQLDKENPL